MDSAGPPSGQWIPEELHFYLADMDQRTCLITELLSLPRTSWTGKEPQRPSFFLQLHLHFFWTRKAGAAPVARRLSHRTPKGLAMELFMFGYQPVTKVRHKRHTSRSLLEAHPPEDRSSFARNKLPHATSQGLWNSLTTALHCRTFLIARSGRTTRGSRSGFSLYVPTR